MKFKLPLFWKFSISIVLIVIIFGSINIFLVRKSIYSTFENELEKRGKFITKSIADRAIRPLLYDDVPALFELLNSIKSIDSNIVYILILDGQNNVLAHTFDNDVPDSLINIKNIESKSIIFKTLTNTEIAKDIAHPILDKDIGIVRVGLQIANFADELNQTYKLFALMILLFLIIGLSAAFVFSHFITNPIKKISKIAESLDIEKVNVNVLDYFKNQNESIFIEDEIDTLKLKFYEMTHRLHIAYTELKSTQESLFQSEKMASIGILSAGVCHEINNPITGIQSCLKRISKNPEDIAQNFKYIELMSEASNKIEDVVKGLLDFSRKYDFAFQSIDILKVIDKILLLIDYELERNNINIYKDYPDSSIIPNIHGNSNLLEQVFLNIILNAIDAINEKKAEENTLIGEIRIVIYLKPGFLQIQINDNGIGVPENKTQNIFDPFFTEKKIKKGTGLGLSICYKIIMEHNGEIFAKNNFDSGLSIIINFPI